jgi:hypothetical protein
MVNLRSFYEEKIVLRPDKGSFSAEGELSRWSNKDLDPVAKSQKKWEWWHVGGFWIAEGFSVATMQTPSSAVALGLNPGLTIAACLIGNLLITIPCCSSGYIGSKVSKAVKNILHGLGLLAFYSVLHQLSGHRESVRAVILHIVCLLLSQNLVLSECKVLI